ncbi:uncharacterized protein LOC132264880 [Phlebotomus argentipes]|uniref:uncharacterized protein LOC132264880 n=1 Tax=Phlebotomus argentipes TaxID=94469 RepID=UPI002892D282|nr:uncharacterized protein LOC132264880 [Phlebotomus argentipes]
MENKFSRNYFSSPCGPQYQHRRSSSTMCGYSNSSSNGDMENLFRSPEASPESILFDLLGVRKQAEPPTTRESRISNIKAACVPFFNSIRDFIRKNLATPSAAPKQDCPTDFSNSSVYMGLVTALPPKTGDQGAPEADLVDLTHFTVIQKHHLILPPKPDKPIEMTDTGDKGEKATKSDLNSGVKVPTRRQREKKTCQNTQRQRKGKHAREKMRKNVIWDMRDDLCSEEDAEEEFEDVLSQEISSSIEESNSSLSPHTSNYESDFIASIPSSQPCKVSPCAFVKSLMDIPFSPKMRALARKSSTDYDSDDSFIVFGTPDSTSPACDRVPRLRACDRRRRLSEDSDDSFVIFVDEKKCLDDSESDCDDTVSETSDSDDESEEYPVQLDSGFEERKVRFNLKPEVHVIRAWDFAYRRARKGHWEQVARDRDRFEKRILSLSSVLSPVLDKSHREKIFAGRFGGGD